VVCSAVAPVCISGVVGTWVVYPYHGNCFCGGDCRKWKWKGEI